MRKFFLLVAALFIMLTMNAQIDLSFGPKVGYQSLIITRAEYDMSQISEGSLTLGAFGRINVGKFIVQPELMFDYRTYNFRYIDRNRLHIESPMLTMPIFFGYHFFENNHIKLRGNLGPVFYFCLRNDFKINDVPADLTDEFVQTMLKPWTHKDVIIGAALNIGIDLWRFVFDFNYSISLTNVFCDVIGHITSSSSLIDYEPFKQNVFTATIGYKIF